MNYGGGCPFGGLAVISRACWGGMPSHDPAMQLPGAGT